MQKTFAKFRNENRFVKKQQQKEFDHFSEHRIEF